MCFDITVDGVQQRIDVSTLVVEGLPIVHVLRIMAWTMSHMPFAKESRRIPGIMQQGQEGGLACVDWSA